MRELISRLREEIGCGMGMVKLALSSTKTYEEARAYLKWNSLAVCMRDKTGRILTPLERMGRGLEIDKCSEGGVE